jgi:hypothetical protein
MKVPVIFGFFACIHVLNAQIPPTLQYGFYGGHVVNFWDDLQDYKRVNDGLNPSYGVKIRYGWKKSRLTCQLGLEEQRFSNIRTAPIFNQGTILRRQIVLKYYNPEITYSKQLSSTKRSNFFVDIGLGLKFNSHSNYTTYSGDGRIVFRTGDSPDDRSKVTFNSSVSYEFNFGRFSTLIKSGPNISLVNIYNSSEEPRNVFNFNSRVCIVSQAVLFVKLW